MYAASKYRPENVQYRAQNHMQAQAKSIMMGLFCFIPPYQCGFMRNDSCQANVISFYEQCAVFTPGLLKSGELGKACLIVKRNTKPMVVNVVIEVKGTKTSIFNQQFPAGDIFRCSDFQVPKQEQVSPVFLLVEAVSGTYNYTARQSVVISPTSNSIFIRSDKYKYKGGQTDDPELGAYQIVAQGSSGKSVSQYIVAEDYVLPKFSASIRTYDTVTIQDKTLAFEVSAKYTYGLPVPGRVSGRLCRPPSYYYVGDPCARNPDGICVPFTGEIDSDGLYKGSIDLLAFQFNRPGYSMYVKLEATVIEQGAGVQVTEIKIISVTTTLGRAYFVDKYMLPYFKKGIPYPVEVMVEDGLGQPQSNLTVQLQVNTVTVQNLTSDKNGKAYYEVDTSGFGTSEVELQLIYMNAQQCYDSNWVVPNYSNDYRSIRRFFSPTQTFVQLQGPREDLECGATYNILVRYVISRDALEEGQTIVKFVFMALSRAKIVEFGEHSVSISTSLQGQFTLTYKVSPDHVPTVQYVVLSMLKKDLVADTTQLNLEKCFKNQVSLKFSSEEGTPGSQVDLNVRATSKSTCIARVFDSSLLLMDQGQTLTPSTVYNALQYLTLNGYDYAGYNVAPPQPPCVNVNEQIVYNSMYYQPVSFPLEEDPGKLFAVTFQPRNTGERDRSLETGNHNFRTSMRLNLMLTSFHGQGDILGCHNLGIEQGDHFFINYRYIIFKAIGLIAVTDTSYRQPQQCFQEQPISFQPPQLLARPVAFGVLAEAPAFATTSLATVSDLDIQVAVRKSISRHVMLLEAGSTSKSLEVPGTITTWKGDAICLSSKTGFGMSKYLANFTSFQKMFVDLSLANSIVRGETMVLVATVANYMDKCAKMNVILAPSSDYTAEAVGGLPIKCVCSKQRISYSWNINAKSLGVLTVKVTAQTIHIGESCEGPPDPSEPNRKDIIVQSFTVEPEGIKQDVTQTNFVCVKGSSSEVAVSINPSGNIVPDSLKATVQVIGDILGPALVRPEALFNEPMGCGEQNLATLMPIPVTMEYLNATGGLDQTMEAKAKQNMEIGYARQMRYRNWDGSFSAFGGPPGSAWLTLQTAKTLLRLTPYIYVEDQVIQQAMLWLANLQNLSTGSFKPKGMLFNSGLKGGADDDVGFTCAMVIFLLETSYASSPTLLRSSVTYLEAASQKDQSVFNIIMLMYVFKAAGNTERANAMATKVKALAIDDGTIHWEPASKPKQQTPYLFFPPASSGAIEMTAIALKAFLYGKTPSTISQEVLNYCTKIALWIVKQQRKQGCYRSTSDTVAALEALTAFAPYVFQKNAVINIQLKKENYVIRTFMLDSSKRFVLQSESLYSLPGNYNMVVSGNGCVLLQTGVEFNVPFNQQNPAFLLSLTTSPNDCQDGVAPSFDIQVNSSYNGIQNKSNMAIIDIHLLSGHFVEYDSLYKVSVSGNKSPKK
ncbi:ovostatin-like [Gastrophryne carolinensis]